MTRIGSLLISISCSVWSGPGRRRFEFMRLPGESKEELVAKTWELLATYKLNRA